MGGSWVQTPLSIEDRNSTVAEDERKTTIWQASKMCTTAQERQRRPKKQSWKWILEVKFGDIGREGIQELRLENDPWAFYQQKPDQETVSAKQFDRTSLFNSFTAPSLLMVLAWSHFRADSAIHNAAYIFWQTMLFLLGVCFQNVILIEQSQKSTEQYRKPNECLLLCDSERLGASQDIQLEESHQCVCPTFLEVT